VVRNPFAAVGAAILSLALVVAVAPPLPATAAVAPVAGEAPGVVPAAVADGEAIPGRYIVTLADEADLDEVLGDHLRAGGIARHLPFVAAAHGFALSATPAAVARLRADDRVIAIEADRVLSANGTQSNATWGLDRVDQRHLPLDGTYRYGQSGRGVSVYVIDSGVSPHQQFGSRLRSGFTSVADGLGTRDCVGHGTHVAGTVGGTIHGIAKEVDLVPVRVLDCDGRGTTSGVVAGIDWVVLNRAPRSVATLSLGGPPSPSLDNAVRTAVAAGVTFAIAAGNGDEHGTAMDACGVSPARVAEALTVAATGANDKRPSWSNTGTCVDLFAPGVGITSTTHLSDTSTGRSSGTSMAVPHVAGVAALTISSGVATSPASVASHLLAATTKGVIGDAGSGSPNRLLFWDASTSLTAPEPMPAQEPDPEPESEPSHEPELSPSPAPAPAPDTHVSTCKGRAYPLTGDWLGQGADGVGWWCDGRVRLRTAAGAISSYTYGRAGDVPVVADWNGDGRDTVSVIRDGTWYVNNTVGGGQAVGSFHYGRVSRGDTPIAGSWRGSTSLPGVIRDREWHLRYALSGGSSDLSFVYGRLSDGDLPLVGDWHADGRDTIGIVREGVWHLRDDLSSGPSTTSYKYGRVLAGDVPVAGDWAGDGRSTPGIVRDGVWHLKHQHGAGNADISITFVAP
jgi:hypothetical protein